MGEVCVTECLRRCHPNGRAARACLRAAIPAAEVAFRHLAGDLRGDRGFLAADRARARSRCRGQSAPDFPRCGGPDPRGACGWTDRRCRSCRHAAPDARRSRSGRDGGVGAREDRRWSRCIDQLPRGALPSVTGRAARSVGSRGVQAARDGGADRGALGTGSGRCSVFARRSGQEQGRQGLAAEELIKLADVFHDDWRVRVEVARSLATAAGGSAILRQVWAG